MDDTENPATDVEKLARDFATVLSAYLGADTMAEVVRRNRTPQYAGSVCASHDFCDANMAMAEAWEGLFGREVDAESEQDCTLWGDAWGVAKQNDFWQPPCPWQTEGQVRAVAEADAWLSNAGLSSYTEMRAALERLMGGHRSGTAAGLRAAMDAARAALDKQ